MVHCWWVEDIKEIERGIQAGLLASWGTLVSLAKQAGQLPTTGMRAGAKVSALQQAPADISAQDHQGALGGPQGQDTSC